MELIGPLQTRVMHHIWSSGPSTVHEVHDALMAEPAARPLAYTTVLTVMRNLVRRGLLAQSAEGRTHRFAARIQAEAYRCELLRQVRCEFFRGDLRAMIEAVVADETLGAEDRAILRGQLLAGG